MVAVQLVHPFPVSLFIGSDAVELRLGRPFLGIRIVGVGIDGDGLPAEIVGRVHVGQFHTVRPVAGLQEFFFEGSLHDIPHAEHLHRLPDAIPGAAVTGAETKHLPPPHVGDVLVDDVQHLPGVHDLDIHIQPFRIAEIRPGFELVVEDALGSYAPDIIHIVVGMDVLQLTALV